MNKILLLALFAPALALASDGVDGVAVGGIVMQKTDSIALKREVLSISRTLVSADYELRNESGADVEETIMFHLPAYPVVAQKVNSYFGEPSGFGIQVDGNSVPFKTMLVARAADQTDVTAQLRKIGLTDAQIAYNPTFGIELAYNPLTPNQIQQLIKLKLWANNSAKNLGPVWNVQASYAWKQKFPVRQTVRVQHVYRPFVSHGPFTESLQPGFTEKFCADKPFMAAWKKANAKSANGVPANHVHYQLKNGNTWKNGIEDFTLNVSKVESSELVSLCFPGAVRKAGAKTFQFRQSNFKPKDDLHIYFGNVGAVKVAADGVMPSLKR